MKKLLFLFCFIATYTFGQQSGVRYNIVPEGGGPFVLVNSEIQTLTYASTKAVATTHAETIMQFATLTGAMTINATVADCYKGDKLYCQFATDGTQRVVTFGTNFISPSTLTIPATSNAEIFFLFNGKKWVEGTRQNTLTPSFTNITANSIAEATAGAGITFSNSTIRQYTATTYTASATVTAAEINKGLLTVASGTVTLTLPTGTNLGSQVNATAGTTIDFVVLNIASGGTATVAANTNAIASGFPGSNTLTLANSATVGIATFRITFISATAYTFTRIS